MKINFKHLQSAHCENGVTTNLLRHSGLAEIDEPLVFGIGAGLFYIHIPFLKINHGPAISFRSMPGNIFSRTSKSLGIEIIRKKFRSPGQAEAFLNEMLAKGIPVGCQVGTFHLPYFPREYRFHFNAHNIVVYGKDDKFYYISDPVMETPTTITPADLTRVRFAKGVLAPKGHIYYPAPFDTIKPETIKRAVIKGLKTNYRHMLYVPGGIAGVKGIAYTARHIRKWRKNLGERRAGLYLAQIVRMQEEIGTGGGGFRFLYAAFLEKAANLFQSTALMELSNDFTKAGDLWRYAALQMSGIYKGRLGSQKDFDEIADILMDIHKIEKDAFKGIARVTKKGGSLV